MSTQFPAPKATFVSIASSDRARIFVITDGDMRGAPESLTQIATVSSSAETSKRLVEELNTAAWTGDRSGLDSMLSAIPAPVAQALEQALAGCPDPANLALGFDQQPLSIVVQAFFSADTKDLALHADSAVNLGLQYLVENSIDDDGRIIFTGTALSDSSQVERGTKWTWWPMPSGQQLLERIFPEPQHLTAAFSDDRWETHIGRAYWVWLEDEERVDPDDDSGSATATWVIEFLDVPLNAETNFRIFIQEDDLDEESLGYLTPRNRFILWLSLWNISSDLDGVPSKDLESLVYDDISPVVGKQSKEWWQQLHQSSDRLFEAARKGLLDELVPRSPAEEALIMLATRSDYVEGARDSLEMFDYQSIFDGLVHCDADDEWREILPSLAGDCDIEMLWEPRFDGINNPDDKINQDLGIGNYRPGTWHDLFD